MALPLFVYGTLQRGERLNTWLVQGGARFDREAATLPKWRLFDLWGSFPAMVPGGSASVAGELWWVDDATLARLDQIEGAYDRKVVTLAGGCAFAWAYVLKRIPEVGVDVEQIEGGNWKQHRDAARAAALGGVL